MLTLVLPWIITLKSSFDQKEIKIKNHEKMAKNKSIGYNPPKPSDSKITTSHDSNDSNTK
jgi:hypothetical protein